MEQSLEVSRVAEAEEGRNRGKVRRSGATGGGVEREADRQTRERGRERERRGSGSSARGRQTDPRKDGETGARCEPKRTGVSAKGATVQYSYIWQIRQGNGEAREDMGGHGTTGLPCIARAREEKKKLWYRVQSTMYISPKNRINQKTVMVLLIHRRDAVVLLGI